MLNAVLDIVLPSVCPSCGNGVGPALCAACTAALPWIDHPCGRCGAPRFNADAVCRACHDHGWPHLSRVEAYLAYAGPVVDLVARSKARSDRAAALALVKAVPLPTATVDAVVPIPVNPGRGAGPHLPQLLARRAAHHLGCNMISMLKISRSAQRQHHLGLQDRERNVDQLYRASITPAATVLLVDDLLTTGATLRAAAKALRQAGARTVHAWVGARTPRHDDDYASEADTTSSVVNSSLPRSP